MDILLDDVADSPRRLQAIRDAVNAPKIYADILNKWPPHEPPSDSTLKFYLLREKSFNEGAIDDFIKNFRLSIAFAKLDKTPTIAAVEAIGTVEKPQKTPTLDGPEIEIGDLVQWEASGVLRMEKPAVVRAFSEDRAWAFVEGSETGIPMEELLLEQKGAPAPAKTPPKLALPGQVFETPITAGEKEWLRGPLSKATSYRLIVNGEVGPKEIGKLIKLLEAQKLVLDDDEA